MDNERGPTLPPPAGPYSHAIRRGRIGYTAGQVGVDSSGKPVSDDCAQQTARALVNLREALNTVGATPADVVRCGVYLTNIDDFAATNIEYAAFFDEPYPARTTVYVGLPAGLLVEIDAFVIIRRGLVRQRLHAAGQRIALRHPVVHAGYPRDRQMSCPGGDPMIVFDDRRVLFHDPVSPRRLT